MRYCQWGQHSVGLQKKNMKKLLLFIASSALLTASCSKKEDPAPATPSTPTTSGIPTNGWKLGTVTYTSAIVAKSGANILSAMDGIPSGSSPAVNSLNVYFSALPTANGTYSIVKYPSTTSLTATQIGVTAGLYATSTTYSTTGFDGINATVTVTGGKIKVVIPEVWVKVTGGGTDSLKLTGTVLEQ